jgi:two-component sensor histidine kinase/CheY-like chemotaxis protein
MLRRQSLPYDTMSFLAGESEMAQRIRAFDWANTPLGPAERWPQSLRSALSICLHSAFPTAIYWGPELRLLYNDAWAPIPGPRHPGALGQPAQHVWSDIWHVLEPQFERLIATGEGTFVEDQMLPMRRFGFREETYWTYSLTAIRGEDGAIAGVFNSGSETTRNVLLQRQTTFLLELAEAFRASTDLKTARQRALEMLGQVLQADRAGFRERLGEGDELTLTAEWTASGVARAASTLMPADLGPEFARRLAGGSAIRIVDVAREPGLGAIRQALMDARVGGTLSVPATENGRIEALVFVNARHPRNWTDFDVSTAEEVLKRTLGWMDRERAAERERIMMREIDHRARNALALVQSVIRLTLAEDIDTYREKIEDRIAALARSHTLFSAQRWDRVELRALFEQELAPYGGDSADRVRLDGPSGTVLAEEAQTLALLLHELTTNAVKHGSLAAPGGRLSVRWSVEDATRLHVRWSETFAAPRPLPVANRQGFGSTLLSSVIEQQLRGRLSRSFGPAGFDCELEIPLATLVTSARAARGAPAATSRAPSSARRGVLILEDDALLAMDLGAIVQDLGHPIFGSFATVADAMAALEAGTPEFAILDLNVAEKTSVPVGELLVARGVPVVFATGYMDVELPSSLAGAVRLTKPVPVAQLEKLLATLSPPGDE